MELDGKTQDDDLLAEGRGHERLYVFTLQISIFIYFWLHWVFTAARSLSLIEASGAYSLAAVCGGLSLAPSLVAENKLSSCNMWAESLHDMWDLPRPGIEPVSPRWQVDSQPLDHQ